MKILLDILTSKIIFGVKIIKILQQVIKIPVNCINTLSQTFIKKIDMYKQN